MPDPMELMEEGKRCEQHGVLDRALENYSRAAECASDPAVVAQALTDTSRIHRCLSEWEPALDAARRAQAAARSTTAVGLLADAVNAEALVLLCRGEYEDALRLFNQILEMAEEPRVRGIALQNIGSIFAQQGKLGAAERAFAESFGWFRHAGYRLGEAMALNNHGQVALDRGNVQLAEQLLEHAIAAARELEYGELIALATLNYAKALSARGQHARAEEQASTALGYFATSGNRWREIECLRVIGAINEDIGDCEDATRCYERALSIAESLGVRQDISDVRDCLTRVSSRQKGSRGATAPASSKGRATKR
jgi:tetratricopeptide (TPR) repeat protein